MTAQDHIDGRERQLHIQRRNNVLSALWLAVWIIFAGIGAAASIHFVITHVFQSGGRCDMSHECPIENCAARVRNEFYMCPRHWRMVPRPLQSAVYASFRATGRISDNHREAKRVVEQAEAGLKALDLPAGTKALTVYQPWATLIILGAKPFEFRKWKFTDKPYLAQLVSRRIVVHASARRPPFGELDDILRRMDDGESGLDDKIARPIVEGLRAALRARGNDADLSEIAPLSVALGTVIIGEPRSVLDIFKGTPIADSDRLDHSLYGWPMIEPKAFERPIPSAGAQGFWNWS
ncbi:hypothetical protein [Bradyrhizobium sp. BR 10289]|uniref:hypothetical protein n=1 Tax=Bradyrhizobium sp. BR 10289 TaxID=2749993 RepID=UPI001C6468EE|nr:hypothetical protein [Bradyrhizobium sp. BR 10289]MBW7968164.1 hypothetical protein [Bradyrhizobium sp. BR 10289]